MPFHTINDQEFIDTATGSRTMLPLSIFSKKTFTMYNSLDDPDDHDPSHESLDDNIRHINSKIGNSDHTDYPYFKSMLKPHKKVFLFNNIRSLTKNFESYISCYLYPIPEPISAIGFCETHLTADMEQQYQLTGFNLFTNNYESNSGGVALYLRESLKGSLIPDLSVSKPHCESLFIEIQTGPRDTCTVGVIYRRPENNFKSFLPELSKLLNHNKVNNKRCTIMGDFNIDLIKYSHSSTVREFVDLMTAHSFFSCINKPTRVTSHSATVIDHIWTNEIAIERSNGILLTDVSDHFSPFTIINDSTKLNKPKIINIRYRNFKNEPDGEMVQEMERLCAGVTLGDDVNIAYERLLSTVNTIFDNFYPIQTKNIKQKDVDKPWIDNNIKALIKDKHRLQAKFNRRPMRFGDQYRTVRNMVNVRIKFAKEEFYKMKLEEANGNGKAIWKILNNLMKSKKSKSTYISKLKVDGREITDQNKIADSLNNFFSNIGKSLSEELPHTDADPLLYMRGTYPTIEEFDPTSIDEIKCIIRKLNKNSPGPDGIPLILLKNNVNMISPLVCEFINLSMSKSVYPSELKRARVTPLFKGGDSMDMGNYRPISNLSIINKIFEKVIHARLSEHIETNNVITNSQFGFRKNLSTQSALLSLTDKILNTLGSNHVGAALFMDFKKAFDSINHDILLRKLQFYGFHGKIYQWIKSYLSNRSQYIKLEEAESSLQNIEFGVPQGSILGPLLFLIFINDMPNCSEIIFFCLFADDSNLFINATDFDSLQSILNNELPKVSNWILVNQLSVNFKKTHYLVFHRGNQPRSISLKLCNHKVPRQNCSKMLGIFIDDKLTWKDHIQHVTKKVASAVGVLNKLKKSLNMEARKILYYSLIYPYLQYCNIVWGNSPPTILSPIYLKQKRAIRIINNAGYIDRTNPLFKNTKIVKLHDIYKLEARKFVNQQLQLQNPIIRFDRANAVHNHYTRRNQNLRPPQPKIELEKRFIKYSGCLLYNELPDNIKTLTNKNTFKINVKKYLLNTY